ncbi:MAG: F0F1 ATP synthase subunit A [Rickettsiaceae bacterium]|nr:F0F1 ATP synthase subunit A [Rickettsiaceae bacterium]
MTSHDSHSPLEQFVIYKIIPVEFFGIDISITNSSATMIVITCILMLILMGVQKNINSQPSKLNIALEMIYLMIQKMAKDNLGEKDSRSYVAPVLTLFLFLSFSNLIGLIPYGFTITSHFAVTFPLALAVFVAVITAGFKHQGLHFLKLFAPSGLPLWLLPMICMIEICTFIARPFTLALRLSANMIAGHVFLKVLAGFMVSLPLLAKLIPVPIIVLVIGFELFVAILQAYIFVVLTNSYLSDGVKGH